MLLFNLLTNRKFDILSVIDNSKEYIEFNSQGFKYSGRTINWENLKNIKISIECYKGKYEYRSSHLRRRYFGYEKNYIEYELNENKNKHFFYIKDKATYLLLLEYFKSTILPTIYNFKNIKNENILINKLEYKELQKFKQKYDIKAVYDNIVFN